MVCSGKRFTLFILGLQDFVLQAGVPLVSLVSELLVLKKIPVPNETGRAHNFLKSTNIFASANRWTKILF